MFGERTKSGVVADTDHSIFEPTEHLCLPRESKIVVTQPVSFTAPGFFSSQMSRPEVEGQVLFSQETKALHLDA
jgi:hypothetical protein